MNVEGPVTMKRFASRRMFQALVSTSVLLVVMPSSVFGDEPDCAVPNVLVMLDVSGSMGPASDIDGKYMAAVTAVADVVTEYAWDIRFGLMVFPDPADAYCAVSSNLAVWPDVGMAEAVKDYLLPGGADFFGGPLANFDTPMYQALSTALGLDVLDDPGRRSYVLLITDGEQDCCTYGDYDEDPDCLPGTNNLDPVEAEENREDLIGVVSDLQDAGIPVFVVGFGDDVDVLALNGMAVAAQTQFDPLCDPEETDPGEGKTCYAQADDIQGLHGVMEEVVLFTGQEVCDGVDNDCDGETDEGFPVGDACDGPDGDSCEDGIFLCDPADGLVCDEQGGAGNKELCNGEDDDCDGDTDEDFAVGLECDGEDADQCADGEYECGESGAGLVCNEAGAGRTEECNGEDDDCDGDIDEDADEPCQTACGNGVKECTGGVLQPCNAQQPEPSEVCGDGKDNDCNGLTDEDFEVPCQNECGTGKVKCTDGVLDECDARLPEPEVCDLVDNDCDGDTDEGSLCGFGAGCFCGGCQAVCSATEECGEGISCTDGFCIDDQCPDGQYCDNQMCVEGEKPAPIGTEDNGPAGGCGCRSLGRVGGLSGWGHAVFLSVFVYCVVRRRRRRRHRPIVEERL